MTGADGDLHRGVSRRRAVVRGKRRLVSHWASGAEPANRRARLLTLQPLCGLFVCVCVYSARPPVCLLPRCKISTNIITGVSDNRRD